MAIPNINKQNIEDAIKYIDENGVPFQNQSVRYDLIMDGKAYPPKYVIAVANHFASGNEIETDTFNAVEAVNYFRGTGYTINEKQVKFELIITSDSITSTDPRFTLNDLSLGDKYKPLDVYFKSADGEIIRRKYNKGERRNSNQTLPRIAFQMYENRFKALSVEQKEDFPVCRYTLDGDMIKGIFTSVEEFRGYKNTIEYLTYTYDNGRNFVIYSWNIFSTLIFVQEALKRFGQQGDQFVLIYREKDEKEQAEQTEKLNEAQNAANEELVQQFNGYINPFSAVLVNSKNIILRGAPGTGKSHLAKEIAADIISNGYFDDYTLLTNEQKQQVEFVQFHPSYDYSDFVEGLRPKLNSDGSMGFELLQGTFSQFIDKARKNYENSQKSAETIEKEMSAQEAISSFFDKIEFGVDKFRTTNGSEFYIDDVDDEHILISIPGNENVKKLTINISEVRKMLESDVKFEKVRDLTKFFGKRFATQQYSYDFILYNEIKKNAKSASKVEQKIELLKPFVFIIDEINRGEISKIFGELFFSIDPGYRGKAGEVSTQYYNMHDDPDVKFYIPENVYIIGTMNDIDRSVDSFDFAMRRRFRFIEIKADDRVEMLDNLDNEELKNEANERMKALNEEISKVDGLNENYQIGAAYFLKLRYMSFEELWTDCLCPLLQDYVRGMYGEADIMERFAKAYGYQNTGDTDEASQNQG